VRVLAEGVAPSTHHVRGTNYNHIGVFEDRLPGRAIVLSGERSSLPRVKAGLWGAGEGFLSSARPALAHGQSAGTPAVQPGSQPRATSASPSSQDASPPFP
jgi:hypothetical protein